MDHNIKDKKVNNKKINKQINVNKKEQEHKKHKFNLLLFNVSAYM